MVSKIFAEGYDLIEFVAGLEEHARNILLSKIKNLESSTINITAEEADRYHSQARHFNEMDLLRMLEIISQLPFRVARSAMPRFEIEVALIKLARMDRAVDISSFLNQAESGAGKKKSNVKLASAEQPENQPIPVEESEPQGEDSQALNLDLIKQEWPQIVKSLISENMQVGTFLTYSFVVSASASEIKIGLPKSQKFQYAQVVKPDNMRWLISHLKDRFHYQGVISFETVDDEKSKSQLDADLPAFEKKDISQSMEGKENINDAIKREPILGTILDVFDGEVK
jgi:DNA polymerase-3 subunit gamma/tau